MSRSSNQSTSAGIVCFFTAFTHELLCNCDLLSGPACRHLEARLKLGLISILAAREMSLYRPLCLLGIDACIYRDMLKWNESFFLQKLVAAWMRILLTFLISNVSWVLANITSESSHCFQKGNRNSGCRLCIMVGPSFWEDYYMLIYTHCWELMNSVGSHGSSSLPFVMKVMVCHFVSDSHEVMTALIVVLP
jgi:hypothetical protein